MRDRCRPTSVSFRALGTTATVVVVDDSAIGGARAEVERELGDIDRTCSRFRADSDITRANDADGAWVQVDDLLVRAAEVALRAARVTGGLVDPALGEAMVRIGYDRDFVDVPPRGPALPEPLRRIPVAGWRLVETDRECSRIRVPRGLRLDLGSTAKALAADRAAARASEAIGGGVLVSLGGDVAVAGAAPPEGWSIGIAEDHAATPEPGETVAIGSGGLATSSTTVRRWSRGGVPVHHIVDPRTGLPAGEVWRAVSVHAATCVDANTASTAAIVLGEDAAAWLSRQGLPARLVRPDGGIVRIGGWPERTAA
jgi:FAD:protein FMN transferase